MAAIVKTSTGGTGQRASVDVTLGASNTLAYEPGKGQLLVLRNPTGAGIACVIDGAGGTTVPVQGATPLDVSAGYNVGTIAAGASVVIPLDSISAYLQGAINVTGSGLIATLLGP
jgi:hypothetical protein